MKRNYNATATSKSSIYALSGLFNIDIINNKDRIDLYYQQGNFFGKILYKDFSDLLKDWTDIKAIVLEPAKPDAQKLATFIGTNSLGYEKGKQYWIKMFYSDKGGVTITDCNGNKKCKYESMKAFMSNWDHINEISPLIQATIIAIESVSKKR